MLCFILLYMFPLCDSMSRHLLHGALAEQTCDAHVRTDEILRLLLRSDFNSQHNNII